MGISTAVEFSDNLFAVTQSAQRVTFDSAVPSTLEADHIGESHVVHTARTIMLAELAHLFDACAPEATIDNYAHAVVQDNVLGKPTQSSRVETIQRLRALYALDRTAVLFRVLRDLWEQDAPARPLLALLCAVARDPVLRASASAILPLPVGAEALKDPIERAVAAAFPDRYSPKTLAAVGRNCLSSWTQSGHLVARQRRKFRAQVQPTPASVAYAIMLGQLSGAGGAALLDTFWTRLLDVRSPDLHAMMIEAARRGWLSYNRAGDTVEIRLEPLLSTSTSERACNGAIR